MSADADKLLAAAEQVRQFAYAPYSHFRVGAAVLSTAGKIYAGCNVENASYGLAVCAERSAIFAAIAAGERKVQALAILSPGEHPARPCGACLQVLHEFAASADLPIFSRAEQGGREDFILRELLPHPFSLD